MASSPTSYTPTTFAGALLKMLGAPLTASNIAFLKGWMAQEGGHWHNTATYNPLNTTLRMAGSRNFSKGASVQAYTSWAQGLLATYDTLVKSSPQFGYQTIVADLKKGNVPIENLNYDVVNSSWGTKGLSTGAAKKSTSVVPAQPTKQPTTASSNSSLDATQSTVSDVVFNVTPAGISWNPLTWTEAIGGFFSGAMKLEQIAFSAIMYPWQTFHKVFAGAAGMLFILVGLALIVKEVA